MHVNEIDDCFADEKDTLKSMSSDILLGLNSCTVAPADSSGEESDTSGKPLLYFHYVISVCPLKYFYGQNITSN